MDRHAAPRGGRAAAFALVLALPALVGVVATAPTSLAAAVSYTAAPVSLGTASLADASGVAVSGSGTAYVLDAVAGAVLTLNGSTVTTTMLSGVRNPQGIALYGSTLYIADTGNHRIVQIEVPTTSGTVVPARVAGLAGGTSGAPVNGPANNSPLNSPRGVAVDSAGTIYIADTGNNHVERVLNGSLTIVAGTRSGAGPEQPGPAASSPLSAPTDVAVDGSGVLYIADTGNSAVAKVSSGTLSRLASVTSPTSLTADAAGTVFVDSGTSVLSISASGAAASIASGLQGPAGLATGVYGTVWVADDSASSPRVVTLSPGGASPTAPRISSPAPTAAARGAAMSLRPTATGFPAPSWSFLGAPPSAISGAAIDAVTGVVTGTPTASATFTIRAANSQGHDDQVITLDVGGVPVAPAKPVAAAGRGSAVVTWTPPTASTVAGEAVIGYVVTPYTGTTAGKPVVTDAGTTSTAVPGLTVGAVYTFTVTAINAYGTGAASPASAVVVPLTGAAMPNGLAVRFSGDDRVLTAVNTSQRLFPDAGSARAVVIASSRSFADSLAGARLASAVGGPLLLTDPGALNSAVSGEVNRVLAVPPTTSAASVTPAGTTLAAATTATPSAIGTVYVLGGTGAVSADVQAALVALSPKYVVKRLEGTDRYGTAVTIAAHVEADSPVAQAPIYVASGINYPDGLAVAALAARTGGVVVLSNGSAMPAATAAYLAKHDPNGERVVPVGGPATAAVGRAGAARALVGADRYDTARLVAARFTADARSEPVAAVGLATGENWPDALAGAAAMGSLGGPLLLTPSAQLSPAAASAVGVLAARGRPSVGLVFGGTSVVSTGAAGSFGSTMAN